mmetsp:Transcript_135214/g.235118  ORF Transcript_135214/g.235118 Transcript_135214/m.235118 type:complete len:82 (+) Transcript_135214:425-670(+)
MGSMSPMIQPVIDPARKKMMVFPKDSNVCQTWCIEFGEQMCGHMYRARTKEDATVANTPLNMSTPSTKMKLQYAQQRVKVI